MCIHGHSHKKNGNLWSGGLALAVIGIIFIGAIVQIGWMAFIPFVLLGILLGILCWFMGQVIRIPPSQNR